MGYDENSRVWFQTGLDPGTIITLDQPVPSQWQIVEKLNEHNNQLSKEERDYFDSGHSFASTKLLCRDPKNHAKEAFVRIVKQLPFRNTEQIAVEARSKQATTYVPLELIAYQKLTQQGSTNTPRLLGYKITTQDKSALAPNGFLIYLAWEIVPGLRLGDKHGPDPFWTLPSSEREEIRASFIKGLLELRKTGYLNDASGLSSLVWHKGSNTVYFLGFREGYEGKPTTRPLDELKWMLMYHLAIAPKGEGRGSCRDVDTSRWRF